MSFEIIKEQSPLSWELTLVQSLEAEEDLATC